MPAPSTPNKPTANSNGSKPAPAAAKAAPGKPAPAAKPGTQKVGAGAATATATAKPSATNKLPQGTGKVPSVGGKAITNKPRPSGGGVAAPSRGGAGNNQGNPLYLMLAIGVLVIGVGGIVIQQVFFADGGVKERFDKKSTKGPTSFEVKTPQGPASGSGAASNSHGTVDPYAGKTAKELMEEEARKRAEAAEKARLAAEAKGLATGAVALDMPSMPIDARTGDPQKVSETFLELMIRSNIISKYEYKDLTNETVETGQVVEGNVKPDITVNQPSSSRIAKTYYLINRLDSNGNAAGQDLLEFTFAQSDPMNSNAMTWLDTRSVPPGDPMYAKHVKR